MSSATAPGREAATAAAETTALCASSRDASCPECILCTVLLPFEEGMALAGASVLLDCSLEHPDASCCGDWSC